MSDSIDLINKFAAKEKELVGSKILAPVLKGATVRVRVGGVICELKTNDRQFEGFAVLEVKNLRSAKIVGEPTLKQTAEYLGLFPCLRLVLINQFDGIWWGLMASTGEKRIQLTGPVPIRLTTRASAFSTVLVRCDGANFWYETACRKRNPAIARYLRESLEKRVQPEQIRFSGMVPAESLAYHMAYLRSNPDYIAGKPGTLDERIRQALQHSGAQLDAFWQQNSDSLMVRFIVDGRTHVCHVSSNLALRSAGICLQGQDGKFDLASLVGVIRESNKMDDEW
ncbi:MAG: hypothetical protein IT342_18830 [Candidatus Melainabacteria bacterium]|nr:hypothetical protein [Candidatus Melainabacteria bacterium]